MIWGENLSADEAAVQCKCGMNATVEVFDQSKTSCGWFCRDCACMKHKELGRMEKLARALVRNRR